MPTLIISARDDRYATYASAKFIGFDEDGHTGVGHDDEVRACVCLVVDRLVARTLAVIGGQFWAEPRGGECDCLRQWHRAASPRRTNTQQGRGP